MLVVIIVIIAVAVTILAGVVSYNRLVRLRNHVASAWSQIAVQLTRRHDLIPNLVETVKGYAAHERQTLEAVVQARNTAVAAQQAGPASQAQAENVLTGALRQLFALSEAYPDLKANDNFLNLQTELASTEDRISLARQSYNDTVMTYITKVQSFPSNMIATMFGFKTPEYFEAEQGSTDVPKVQF
jgi:LemA protein